MFLDDAENISGGFFSFHEKRQAIQCAHAEK